MAETPGKSVSIPTTFVQTLSVVVLVLGIVGIILKPADMQLSIWFPAEFMLVVVFFLVRGSLRHVLTVDSPSSELTVSTRLLCCWDIKTDGDHLDALRFYVVSFETENGVRILMRTGRSFVVDPRAFTTLFGATRMEELKTQVRIERAGRM